MTTALDAIRTALRSCEYRCPGGHRLDGARGDLYDYADEMMDEMGYPEDWDFERLSVEHPEEYKALREKQEANWVASGKCGQSVEITMEYDGEDGEYSYPVAVGPCVEALGVDEDCEYGHPLWQRAFERWSLAKILSDAEFGIALDVRTASTAAQTGEERGVGE